MVSTHNSWFHTHSGDPSTLHPGQWLALGQGHPLLSVVDTHNLLWATWLFAFEVCTLKAGDKYRESDIVIILGTSRALSSFWEEHQVVATNTHPCAAIPPFGGTRNPAPTCNRAVSGTAVSITGSYTQHLNNKGADSLGKINTFHWGRPYFQMNVPLKYMTFLACQIAALKQSNFFH